MIWAVQHYLLAHFVGCTKFVKEFNDAIVAMREPEVTLPREHESHDLSGWALSVPCLLPEVVLQGSPDFGVVRRRHQFWYGVCPEFSAAGRLFLLILGLHFLHDDVCMDLGSSRASGLNTLAWWWCSLLI